MKTNSRSYRRHRNPDTGQKQMKPFFEASQAGERHSGNAFFQPKLAIGESGDKYEREADAVADHAVNGQPARPQAVSGQQVTAVNAMPDKKEQISPIQKKDDPLKKEKEKPVQKMDAPGIKEKEKPVQKKDDPLKKEKEKPLQKMDAPGMKEEEKPAQKKDDPMKKEEEKPVQKKEEHEKNPSADEAMENKKEKGDKPPLMAKANNNSTTQDTEGIAGKLQLLKDKGNPLPHQLKNEMSRNIGADFSGVNIHTGNESSELNKQMGAQAFTHGNNIYFNDGKYNPQTSAGKHLLAHELTHVVQQGAVPRAKSSLPTTHPASTTHVQRDTSTPLPEGVTADKKSKVAKFSAGGFSIKIMPDKKAKKGDKNVKPGGALTNGNITAGYTFQKSNGKIVSVAITKELVIQTTYGVNASSEMDSAYGRGSIKKDKDEGHPSLGFHEGNHGKDFIEYVKTNPYPEIQIKEPVTEKEFQELVKEWQAQCRQYQADMEANSKQQTDDIIDPVTK